MFASALVGIGALTCWEVIGRDGNYDAIGLLTLAWTRILILSHYTSRCTGPDCVSYMIRVGQLFKNWLVVYLIESNRLHFFTFSLCVCLSFIWPSLNVLLWKLPVDPLQREIEKEKISASKINLSFLMLRKGPFLKAVQNSALQWQLVVKNVSCTYLPTCLLLEAAAVFWDSSLGWFMFFFSVTFNQLVYHQLLHSQGSHGHLRTVKSSYNTILFSMTLLKCYLIKTVVVRAWSFLQLHSSIQFDFWSHSQFLVVTIKYCMLIPSAVWRLNLATVDV